jgi:hypothetical protein
MKKYLLLFLFAYFSSLKASPVNFNFSHYGFEEDASITGTFTGEDLNGNGKLEAEFDEVTAFKMTFSGNSKVQSFSIGLADASIFDFTYDLDGEDLAETDFDGIFVESNNGVLDYHGYFTPNSSDSSVSDVEHGVSKSSQTIQVSAIPVSAIAEMNGRANQDSRFGSSIIYSYGESLDWHSDWELRWLNFNFSGNRIVRIFHATNKQNPSIKYTIFKDPNTGEWIGWVRV